MHAVVGPILLKEGGYAFDLWTLEEGLTRGYAYRCVEDAHYARNIEIRSQRRERSGLTLTCNTLAEFTSAVVERGVPYRAFVSNLEARSVAPAHPLEKRPASAVAVVHSLSGTPASSSSSHTVAVASEGARQSPRGESDPPEEIFGPLGRAERLNWLSWKKR